MTEAQKNVTDKLEGVSKDNWRLHHFAFAVKDLEKATEIYRELGIGKIEEPFIFDSATQKKHTVWGKPIHLTFRLRMIYIGSFPLELVQPLTGYALQNEFLEEHGDGVHHICFTVDDIEKEEKRMVELGYPVVIHADQENGGGMRYFDTRKKLGGVFLELIENAENPNPEWVSA